MSTRHIIIAAHDGVLTRYTGVGTILQNTIRTIDAIRVKLPVGTRVHLACPVLGGDTSAEDRDCAERSRALVAATGGRLIALDNGTTRSSKTALWGYGRPRHWGMMSASLAQKIRSIIEDAPGPVVVMAHDSPFLHLQLESWTREDRARRTFFFPHSTGANHGPHTEGGPDPERLDYERACLSAIARDPRSFLCATGPWVADHLEGVYGVRPDPEAYLPNGLHFPSYTAALQRRVRTDDLRRRVPILSDASRVIFSWGRASRVKGFVPLIEGWGKVAGQHPDHILVLQAPNESGESDYFTEITDLARTTARCAVVNDFDPAIWQAFLRSPLTDVVAIPSLADPNPHTPLEARLFSRGDYVIAASRIDGIVDSLSDDQAVLVDAPDDGARWADALATAIATGPAWRREAARRSAMTMDRFDFSASVGRFLDRMVFPALCDVS